MDQGKKENPFFKVLLKLLDLIGLTSLWVIFSLPVITAGAALCAFYYTMRKNIREERNHVWSCFWHSFKANLKQATGVTCIFLAVALFLYGDIAAINALAETGRMSSGFTGLFCVLLALLAIYAEWVFIYMSAYENSVRTTLKNALFISVSNLPTTLLLALYLAATAAVVYVFYPALVILPGAFGWLASVRTDKVFEKYGD